MELTQFENNYIFKTRIDLEGGEFIVLREPNEQELSQVTAVEGDKAKMQDQLMKIMPACIVESSFTVDGAPATGHQVYDQLKRSSSLVLDIVTAWFESVPFGSRLQKSKK